MTAVDLQQLAAFLGDCVPFDTMDPKARTAVAAAAAVERYGSGELILDAFGQHTGEMFVVVGGRVELWNNADHIGGAPDELVDPGGLFGFSAMLTERSIGPRAVAVTAVTVARIPAAAVATLFASRRGARFLADRVSAAGQGVDALPTYSTVDELIVSAPLAVHPSTPAGEVARRMTEAGGSYAAVPLGNRQFGIVTDRLLRRHILVEGLPVSTPASAVMEPAPVVGLGDSASEALILLLEREAEFVLVADPAGELRGVVEPRDFAVSSTTADVSLHEQLRRADSTAELAERARRVPAMLGDLLSRGLASAKVITIYSATLDTVVRRAIDLVFQQHPELSVDAFTWLTLGSNGRRETVLSSDLDSAVAFDDDLPTDAAPAYRKAFAEVYAVLARAGLSSDDHGATAQRPAFARTNADWRAAGRQWLAAPADNQGAIMTSLLVDGRPIHGDPGLPAVKRVFSELRRHPGTMRLLLQQSLSSRARLRSMRDVFSRRPDTFDIKDHAVLPIVNIGRWAALSVGSAALPTTERLWAAAGSAMLPGGQATTLVEVFEVLQRLRLRYQLLQVQAGEPATDLFTMDRVSAIDRSVIVSAVREITAVQRRMDNVAVYLPPESWTDPEPD